MSRAQIYPPIADLTGGEDNARAHRPEWAHDTFPHFRNAGALRREGVPHPGRVDSAARSKWPR
eukprot:8381521-Pyramimonas_sp.AAC.1